MDQLLSLVLCSNSILCCLRNILTATPRVCKNLAAVLLSLYDSGTCLIRYDICPALVRYALHALPAQGALYGGCVRHPECGCLELFPAAVAYTLQVLAAPLWAFQDVSYFTDFRPEAEAGTSHWPVYVPNLLDEYLIFKFIRPMQNCATLDESFTALGYIQLSGDGMHMCTLGVYSKINS